jgi:hypothetical protein
MKWTLRCCFFTLTSTRSPLHLDHPTESPPLIRSPIVINLSNLDIGIVTCIWHYLVVAALPSPPTISQKPIRPQTHHPASLGHTLTHLGPLVGIHIDIGQRSPCCWACHHQSTWSNHHHSFKLRFFWLLTVRFGLVPRSFTSLGCRREPDSPPSVFTYRCTLPSAVLNDMPFDVYIHLLNFTRRSDSALVFFRLLMMAELMSLAPFQASFEVGYTSVGISRALDSEEPIHYGRPLGPTFLMGSIANDKLESISIRSVLGVIRIGVESSLRQPSVIIRATCSTLRHPSCLMTWPREEQGTKDYRVSQVTKQLV